MTKKMRHIYSLTQITRLFAIAFSLSLLISCERKTNNDSFSENMVNVSLSTEIIEDDDISTKAESERTGDDIIIRTKSQINDKYELVAEYTPIENINLKSNKIISKMATINTAAITSTPLITGAKYILKAYPLNYDGSPRPTEQAIQSEYTVGSPVTSLKLYSGTKYRFIAYTRNTSSSPTGYTYTPANAPYLQNADITSTNGEVYIFDKIVEIMPQPQQTINISFKRLASSINSVAIDATQINQPIQLIDAEFINLRSDIKYKISDMSSTHTVGPTTQAITFPSLASAPKTVTSTTGLTGTHFIQNNTNFLTLKRLRIGGQELSNLSIANNGLLKPGKKYNLKLSIKNYTPLDPGTVDINGQVWMKYNVGVDPSLDHDDLIGPYGYPHFGYAFVFGRKAPYDYARLFPDNSPTTQGITYSHPGGNNYWHNYPPTLSGFEFVQESSSIDISSNSWNIGTEANPQKNLATDPCPVGYRVPTLTELTTLKNLIENANWQGDAPAGNSSWRSAQVTVGDPALNQKITFGRGVSLKMLKDDTRFPGEGTPTRTLYVFSKSQSTLLLWSSHKDAALKGRYLRVYKSGFGPINPPSTRMNISIETTDNSFKDAYGGQVVGIRCIKQGPTEIKQ